jgi:tryptophan synthase beta chain
MERLGAKVIPVNSGSRTLKDAINEAIRDWVSNVDRTHYLLGSVVGPHPYPMIVRDFQSVIGAEVKKEFSSRGNRFPDYLIACVGGGSNAAGIFYPFIDYPRVRKIGVEAAGVRGISGASLCQGRPGVLHGAYTYLLQDDDGQIKEAHSIAPGLDYPGVGPELSYWKEAGLVEYHQVGDREAVTGFKYLAQVEGIIPALEPSHAVAFLLKFIKKTRKGESVVLNLSGRGDKDLGIIEGK